MRHLLSPLALLTVLSACSGLEAPICAKQPDSISLEPAERLALADAMIRYGKRCDDSPRECAIKVAKNPRGEILVTIASIYPDRSSGQCLQAPGDQDLAVYTSDGAFKELALSL